MRTFRSFVDGFLKLMVEGREIVLGEWDAPIREPLPSDAPVVAILSSHPDDEGLMGMPAGIRFRRAGFRVVNVAATLGQPEQYGRRLEELTGACKYLDIELIVPHGPDGKGLRDWIISSKLPNEWLMAVRQINQILDELKPRVIITHHEADGHPAHIQVNLLIREVLSLMRDFECLLMCGEFWQDMTRPNLHLEVSPDDLAELLEALSFHKGELCRNPYHLLWPSYLAVKVRNGELVTGWGTGAPAWPFAAMYRVTRWSNGTEFEDYLRPTQLGAQESINSILPPA